VRRLFPAALVGLLCALAAPHAVRAQEVDHVFVVVIDGLRAEEGFADPAQPLLAPLVDELAPLGTLLTRFEIRDQTHTLPSHQSLLTGNYADFPNFWPDAERVHFAPRTPTLFEAYRLASGAGEESCWVVSNTPLAGHDLVASAMPGYGAELAASRRYDPENLEEDEWVWEQVDDILAEHEVSLMLINVSEVDRKAHELDWDAYTGNATDAAAATVALWDRLQADPAYRDRTALLVTTDHGRHQEGVEDGWVSHGCGCRGCRRSFLLAVGPGIRADRVSEQIYSSLDLAPTLAHLLGLPFPYHRGRVITEILEDADDVLPGVGGHFGPRTTGAGALAVRVSEWDDPSQAEEDGGQRVMVELSEDGGESWSSHVTGAGPAIQRTPAAWTDGEVVVVGWLELAAGGEDWTVRVRRRAPTDDGWDEVLEEPMVGASTPVGNLVLTEDRDGLLWLFENNALNERIRWWSSEDRGDTWSVGWDDHPFERYFPRDAQAVEVGDVWLMAYSAHAEKWRWQEDLNDNTEIYWLRSDDGGHSWEGGYPVTDDDAPSIQPAVIVDGDDTVHLVWADAREGAFQLYHARSTDDGVTFSTPARLTSGSLGAWEPALAVDGDRVHVTWSQFDERDRASVWMARLDGDSLTDERPIASPDGVARTPTLLPFGDCSALLSWTESDLQGPWELLSTPEITGERPAREAQGQLSAPPVIAGGPAFELKLTVDVTLDPGDLGFDRVTLVLPDGFGAEEGVGVDVDGDPVDGTATVDGGTIALELTEPVTHDGARVTLRLTGLPPADAAPPAQAVAELARGDHPCATPVDGDLPLGAEASDEGDDDDSTGGGLGETEGCRCSGANGAPASPLGWLALLVLLAVRWRPGSPSGSPGPRCPRRRRRR